ncbi:hypothetical protein [Sphingomonas sp.]|uniref:hypothetical protein n=1 Tax=Sphingomonas sp. TaxID=28214 RepID=UPI00257A8F05|nr:hypothetical protein [Sphingomonas sp.]
MDVAELTVAQKTLRHRLVDLPSSAFPHIKMGYTLLGNLETDKLNTIIDYVSSNFSKRSRYDPDVAASLSGIDRNIVGDLLSAVALTVGSVFDIDVSKDDFFDAAPEGLIDEQSRPIVSEILGIALKKKDAIKRDFDVSKVANSILPSFRYIDFAIDARIAFNAENDIIDKVPLAVFYLNLDTDEDICFQSSLSDLDELISKLKHASTTLAL